MGWSKAATSGRPLVPTLGLALLLGVAAPAALADGQPAGYLDLFSNAKTTLAFRYRFEFVDQDAFSEHARASTLRTRISYQSGSYLDFSFLLEADDIREVIWRDFNAGEGNTPNRTQYPVVADPKGTELNQAYVTYKGIPYTQVKLGRQRILLDNQRFVGAVGWRQNEQTFDAVALGVDISGINAQLIYVDRVNRIFGERVPAGRQQQDGTWLGHVSTGFGDIGRLSAYGYLIDSEIAPVISTRTLGARWVGKFQLNQDLRLDYQLEAAHQTDAGDNPASFNTRYLHGSVGLGQDPWRVEVGYENLGGDEDNAGRALRTPFATAHAFNGRTDKFVNTPDAGLEDIYAKAQLTVSGFQLELRYHDFSPSDGSGNYGNEWSAAVGRNLGQHLRADLIAASFKAKDIHDDTKKAWLMLSASF